MVEWYLWVSEIRCSWLDVRTVGWCGLCSFHHLLIWKCFFWTINSSFITLFLSFSSCSSQSDHTRVEKEEGSTMKSLVPGPRSLVPVPRSLVPVPRSLGPGPWSLIPGPWSFHRTNPNLLLLQQQLVNWARLQKLKTRRERATQRVSSCQHIRTNLTFQ